MRKYLLVIIVSACSLLSNAKDMNPLEGWEFVAVIARSEDGDISIIVLKDSESHFSDKKSVEVLRSRFKNKEPIGPTGWIYSMAFRAGKRSDRTLNVGENFSSEVHRNLLPFVAGTGVIKSPQPQEKSQQERPIDKRSK